MASSDDDVASVTDGTEEVLHRLIGTGSENKKANINKAANSNNIYNRSQTLEDLDVILVSEFGCVCGGGGQTSSRPTRHRLQSLPRPRHPRLHLQRKWKMCEFKST